MEDKKQHPNKGRTPKRYTDEEVAYIEEQVNAGTAIKDIASHLGRSAESVRGRVRMLREKGKAPQPPKRKVLPEKFVEHTAGAYKVPTHVVEALKEQGPSDPDECIAFVHRGCELYHAQGGACYYLGRPFLDNRLLLPIYDEKEIEGDLKPVLVCKAFDNVFGGLSHGAVLGLCQAVIEQENDRRFIAAGRLESAAQMG